MTKKEKENKRLTLMGIIEDMRNISDFYTNEIKKTEMELDEIINLSVGENNDR